VHPVIGTSGWPEAEARALARRCAERRLGALLVPNFSLGAVLQMRVAEQLAAHLTCTGIEEVHHPAKRDAPSGTARATAERIARAGGRAPPPIASERREGVLAEQTIRFAGPGETLSLSHAVDDRRAYLPGLLLAVRRVVTLSGLQVGLDGLLA
jgi:4-hydroxy-tetrahydrodipicolinate reductase